MQDLRLIDSSDEVIKLDQSVNMLGSANSRRAGRHSLAVPTDRES